MLTLKADADAGCGLRDEMIPQMIDLARRTGCRIEIKGNETTFWAHPADSVEALQAAYDRLYPQSAYVSVRIAQPAPRLKPAA
jgi:hypothetical protein